MKYLGMLFMAIALISMPSVAKAANLLTNSNFDSGIAPWNNWNGADVSTVYKQSAPNSLHAWGDNSTSDTGAWQSVSVTPGVTYSLSGYILSPNGVGNDQSPLAGGASAFYSVEWAGGGRLDTSAITGTTNALWVNKQINWTAPTGITSAAIVAKIQRATGSSGDVYFDDLDFDVIPEPTSMLLLGSGLLGLFGISRRKK